MMTMMMMMNLASTHTPMHVCIDASLWIGGWLFSCIYKRSKVKNILEENHVNKYLERVRLKIKTFSQRCSTVWKIQGSTVYQELTVPPDKLFLPELKSSSKLMYCRDLGYLPTTGSAEPLQCSLQFMSNNSDFTLHWAMTSVSSRQGLETCFEFRFGLLQLSWAGLCGHQSVLFHPSAGSRAHLLGWTSKPGLLLMSGKFLTALGSSHIPTLPTS